MIKITFDFSNQSASMQSAMTAQSQAAIDAPAIDEDIKNALFELHKKPEETPDEEWIMAVIRSLISEEIRKGRRAYLARLAEEEEIGVVVERAIPAEIVGISKLNPN